MFKVAGVSRCKGVFKVRFANDMDRVKVLVKTGHDEISLVELPEALDKPAVVTFLKGTDLMNRAEYRAAIESADVKYNGTGAEKPARAPKAEKAPKAAKTVKVAGVKVKVKASESATAEAGPGTAPAQPAGNWFEQQFASEIAASQTEGAESSAQ